MERRPSRRISDTAKCRIRENRSTLQCGASHFWLLVQLVIRHKETTEKDEIQESGVHQSSG